MTIITARDFFSLYLKYNHGIEIGFKFQLSPPTVTVDKRFYPFNALVELSPVVGGGELVKTTIPIYQNDLTGLLPIVLPKGNRQHISELINDLQQKLNAVFTFGGEEYRVSLSSDDIYDTLLPTPPNDGTSSVIVQIKETCFFFKGLLSIKLTP